MTRFHAFASQLIFRVNVDRIASDPACAERSEAGDNVADAQRRGYARQALHTKTVTAPGFVPHEGIVSWSGKLREAGVATDHQHRGRH
jgi:hypothetical protein